MSGGEAGANGSQTLIAASGESLKLKGVDQREVNAGDRLIVETPGGGGWGAG
jgi:5-oxoprolinase (ATP-hydrolysing)